MKRAKLTLDTATHTVFTTYSPVVRRWLSNASDIFSILHPSGSKSLKISSRFACESCQFRHTQR